MTATMVEALLQILAAAVWAVAAMTVVGGFAWGLLKLGRRVFK